MVSERMLRTGVIARRQEASVFNDDPTASVQLDGLLVHRFALAAGKTRKTASVQNDPNLLCVLVRAGAVGVSFTHEPATQWKIDARRGFFLRSSEDYLLNWTDDTEVILVVARERLVTDFGASVDGDRHPLFAESSGLVGPTTGFFAELLGSEVLPGRVAAYALSRLAEEMLGSLFLERSSVGADRVPESPSLYRRALALMAARRAEASWTTAVLAIELAVSPRHLQRAFQAQGTSPSAELRRLRVELAVQLLTQPRYRMLSIADVARYAGFTTIDDLRRAFRIERMPAPSRVRANAAPAETKSVRRARRPDARSFVADSAGVAENQRRGD